MSSNSSTRVIVGMSGGVDSSLSAVILREVGYQVEGVFMQNWEDDDSEHCTIRQDYRDALAVSKRIGITLHSVNFSREYWDGVFEHFLSEYAAGRTPNPDILCNREIKFKAFLDYAEQHGADYIATGHYARTSSGSGCFDLLRGVDQSKDQSYFLYTLGQRALSRSLFPVGSLQKSDVREMAKQHGLHVHSKKDSTGICFIGERKFNAFLSEYLPAKPGRIMTDEGKHIGQHDGLMYYTLGQRQGLGIGGLKGSNGAPWYVLDKLLQSNQLVVGQGHNHPRLFKKTLLASQLHWTQGEIAASHFSCTAKVRYRQTDQACDVHLHQDGTASIVFEEPVRAITPGQSIVFYQDERCLGGGVIEQAQAITG